LKASEDGPVVLNEEVSIYSRNNTICVKVPGNTGQISIYNILGQLTHSVAIQDSETIIPVENSGSYIVRVMHENRVEVKKTVIK
jgi:hypothetical protein